MGAPREVQEPGLRERHGTQSVSSQVADANTNGRSDGRMSGDNAQKEKKTFGRTPDGTVFTVPQTHDMVSQLLDPRHPKNLSDLIVLGIIALHILLLYLLPNSFRRPVFAVIFLFWRGCYNIGIGYLLQIQSHHRRLVKWAEKSKVFADPATGQNPWPWLYKWLKWELETKIQKGYMFEDAPIEYNTWLVFRRVVDLILMCDFTSYCLFAIACGSRPVEESFAMMIARWTAGIVLVVFNLWVKLDAHRVVKDYAWYWGDFFYLIDQELTFDGIFEMAPHPMYSVGYAGYYGISMMAASYSVLFISIIAHAAQFAFLSYVENPHIEKTYNTRPPRKREVKITPNDIRDTDNVATHTEGIEYISISTVQPSPLHNLMGLKNLDPYRVIDFSAILLQSYIVLLALLTPTTPLFQGLFLFHAIVWRLWYSVGLGLVLDRQSNKKMWTRHFVKFGEGAEEAWRQWKGIYHLSMHMSHVSFIAACWKMYSLPVDWGYGTVLLRHIVGAGFVVLQIWTAVSIYDSLGEFGWFFGDFFFDQAPKLTYSGIYRYLNNPERMIGLAGFWGAVLITNSRSIFCLALLNHTLTIGFIQFVEQPHMQKLYGRSLRKEAGLTKGIRRSLPPPLKQWQGSVDKVLGETGQLVEEFIDAARPKLAAGVSMFVNDTSALFSQYPAKLTRARRTTDLTGYNPRDYSLEIEGKPSSALAANEKVTGKEGEIGRQPIIRRSNFETLMFEYGAPIRVKWTAPANHSKKDWIGLYMVADNASREVTRVSSAGRWTATNPNEYDSTAADQGIRVYDQPVSAGKCQADNPELIGGEMVFDGDKLWWTHGVFEFRYHHDGKHDVMAISLPFEIRIGRFDEHVFQADSNGSIREAIEHALLPVVRNCLDRDPDIAPNSVDETFGALAERDGKYAKRVVFAVHQMFGIKFAPGVVLVDGTVRNLAHRICSAKQVLAPYSMVPGERKEYA